MTTTVTSTLTRTLTGRTRVVLLLLLPELLLVATVFRTHAPAVTALRTALGLPAALVVPGHLALSSLDRRRAGLLGRSDEVVFSAALLIALGLLLDVAHVPLRPLTWAVGLLVLCLLLAVPVLRRPDPEPPAARGPFPVLPTLLVLEFALVFGAAAFASILTARHAEDQTPVLALSLVPAGQQVQLRVAAEHGDLEKLVLKLRRSGAAEQDFDVQVSPGHPWTAMVARTAGMSAQLVDASAPGSPLREVQLGGQT